MHKIQLCQNCNFLYQLKTRFSFLGSLIYLTIILFSHKIGKFPSDKKIVIATSFICRLNIENWSMHLDLFDFLLSRTRIMKHSVHMNGKLSSNKNTDEI